MQRIYSRLTSIFFILFIIFSSTGCVNNSVGTPTRNPENDIETIKTVESNIETSEPDSQGYSFKIRYPENIPNKLAFLIEDLNQGLHDDANTEIELSLDYFNNMTPSENVCSKFNWYYLVVAPFPTIMDTIAFDSLLEVWHTDKDKVDASFNIYLSKDTYTVLSNIWGESDSQLIHVENEGDLLSIVWQSQNGLAIIPFEKIDPRWKVIRIDGTSILSTDIDLDEYPLKVTFGITANDGQCSLFDDQKSDQITEVIIDNFKPEKLTSIIMTGTTALVRNTALRMEEKGYLYPAEDIQEILLDADFTHISNEVPFSPDCPPADPVRTDWDFCSDPAYLELLRYIDADIIELTGNHVMDWGTDAFNFTLNLYDDNGFLHFGGGKNIDDAREPLLIEHNGNKIALLGCNSNGPTTAWATEDSPGAAPCDKDWIKETLNQLVNDGYVPIFTFQHIENCDYTPHIAQQGDSIFAAESGAAIVSGSQAHCPQSMHFEDDRFVHYGLGNLFFDQMDTIMNRRQLIDKHFVYNGRYISTELMTTILEDSAKPRVMDDEERVIFLTSLYNASGWSK